MIMGTATVMATIQKSYKPALRHALNPLRHEITAHKITTARRQRLDHMRGSRGICTYAIGEEYLAFAHPREGGNLLLWFLSR